MRYAKTSTGLVACAIMVALAGCRGQSGGAGGGVAISPFTIMAEAGEGGTISPSGVVTAQAGSNKVFTITPSPGYRVFDVQVDGSSVGIVTSYTFVNVRGNHTIEVSFAAGASTLVVTRAGTGSGTVSSSPTGISCGSDCTETYDEGTVVTLTASPDASSTFAGWSGACTGGGPCTVTMNGVESVTATFMLDTSTITASAAAGGTITPSGAVSVVYGSSQAFTITPSAGYRVSEVQVDGISIGSVTSYTFTNVTSDHTIHAVFAVVSAGDYSLNVTRSGTGSGTVGSSPAGISCGADCSQVYSSGTVVTLAATPDGTSTFEGWSGACTGTGPCVVTMDDTKDVTASFALRTYTITASAGTGGSISPSGAVTVDYGDSQTFAVTPSAGYQVDDVRVDGASVGVVSSYTFTNVIADHTIQATFAIQTYNLVVTRSGSGFGTVTSSPAGITCGGDCTEAYDDGVEVTLTADPDANSTFEGWSGACSGTGPCTVLMDNMKNVTATFMLNSFTITATAGTGGSISPSGDVTVEYGSSQAFTITPSAGSAVEDVLVDGSSVGPVTSYTFTNVTADHTISATFVSGTGSALLTWDAPTTNDDGTPLTDLAGYRIHYGAASGSYDTTVDVGDVTTYSVEDIPFGTYYFVVTAYNESGAESRYSNEASKIIQ